MAYALRYYKEIPQADGSVIRLEIHKKDSTASPVEIGAVLQGLSLEIQGQQDEIDTPIVKTSLSMTFVDAPDLENEQKNGFWEEFYTPDAVLWRVILKAKKAQETDFLPIWGGYVTPDSFSETLIYRGSVNIIARDNLGHLQDFPFDAQGDSNGMISLFNLVNAGMAKIETPMDIQWAAGVLWMQTEGVYAYDTLMNVSAFEGKNWYEAIEEALYSYGATMRYVGGNMISIAPLRYLPSQGMESVDAVPHLEPRFAVGATRELIPAVRRIEESVGYDLEAEFQPRVLAQDFSGNSFDVETSWGSARSTAWSLVYTTPMFRFGWYNEVPFKTLAFNPRAYEVRNITSEDDVRNIQENTCILTGSKDDNTHSLSYAMQVEAEDYAINITFGKWLAVLTHGDGVDFLSYPFDEPPTDYEVKYAIKVESNGVTYYLSLNGEWVSEMAAHTIEVTGDKMSVNVPLSGRFMGNVMVSLVFLNINTHENRVRIKQILALSLSPVGNKPMQETNNVYTNYVQENNVILTRDPHFAPAMNSVALPAFIGNGIFYQRGDSVLPARSWGWQGGSKQQMAVWNHLSLLSYYAKPNNLVSGTIVNADITGGACIYVWKDKEHILVSGRYNYLTEQIEGAVLREFARYEDMWSEVAGADLPTTEVSSRSNVESEGASAAPASTYTSTQTVNIGSTGGGGGGASYLNDLIDVNVEGVGAQSLLYFNGAEWVAQNKAMFLKGVTDRLSILERFWYDEEGCLCTDMDVKVKGNIVATGEVSAGGSAEEEEQQGDVYRMFHYKQETPSKEWKIAHYLGKFPNVKVVDSLKQLCYGDVFFDDANNIRIVFGAAESGDAYLD